MTSEAVEAGRASARARMSDSCIIGRGSGSPVFDETTGTYTEGSTTVYTGPCRVRSASTVAFGRDAGEQFTFGTRVTVSIPAETLGIVTGDLVAITAAPFNPQLVNAKFRVRSVEDSSQATALRLQCEST